MSKKYNMEKRSDMQRLHCDMMKKIESIAEEKAKSIYDKGRTQNINYYGTVFSHSYIECLNCHNKVPATMGYSMYSVCQDIFCVTSQTVQS